jgi:hypothetical protein
VLNYLFAPNFVLMPPAEALISRMFRVGDAFVWFGGLFLVLEALFLAWAESPIRAIPSRAVASIRWMVVSFRATIILIFESQKSVNVSDRVMTIGYDRHNPITHVIFSHLQHSE